MNAEEKKEFGARLRRLRKYKKISIRDMADSIGAGESTIIHYENGTREPSVERLRAIARRLDVPIDYLFAEDEEHKNMRRILETMDLTWDGTQLNQEQIEQVKKFLLFLIQTEKEKEN